MEYKVHEVIAEQRLEDIARMYNVSVEEIKKVNPTIKIFKPLFGNTEVVACLQQLKIPLRSTIKSASMKNLSFDRKARFRCKQINATKVLDNVTFSSEINTQYILSTSKDSDILYFWMKMEDYVYQINPKEIEKSFELIKPIEFLKNNIKFSLNDNAKFEKIINFEEIGQKCIDFRNNKLNDISFFNLLKEQSEQSCNDFIKNANFEFSNESKFREILEKNLFYHIFLKASVGNKLKSYVLFQDSQLFPHQKLEISVNKTVVSEDDNIITIRLIGDLCKDKLSVTELKKMYNEIYKPMLKYSYTDYDYVYRITYTLDKKTGILLDGKALLIEKIKNNFENLTQFEVKQIEL